MDDNLRKSLVKISEGEAHVPACHFWTGFWWSVSAIMAILFLVLYTEISILVTGYDRGATVIIFAFLGSVGLGIWFRRTRNREFMRLREGAMEVHDALRVNSNGIINHPTQEVSS